MTARAAAPLLRRIWLLAATLAVIAGLLGMHVLTPGHGSHGPGPQAGPHGAGSHGVAAHSGPHADAPAGHAGVERSAVELSAGGSGADEPAAKAMASAGCGSACPLAQESGAQCVPSAPSGPQQVHPPQAAPVVLPPLPTSGSPGPAYVYLPPSPTPCDLSISRT